MLKKQRKEQKNETTIPILRSRVLEPSNKTNQNKCFICDKERDSKGKHKTHLLNSKERQESVFSAAKQLGDIDLLNKTCGVVNGHIDMIALV